MKKPLQFKISSALKNIIGSDLINDDFIAVFELVKNAYDAHATKVEITFSDIYSKDAKIIIKDDGKGMNYLDLVDKWLFVAYSAKKEGTEEDSYDFRDKIKVKRAYAGAKGIGRFSCDRLGNELYLETIKNESNPKVESLLTEWDKFEEDLKDEFVNITVLHETKDVSSYDVEYGTVLEISDLKSPWDREKFLKLKDSLARLINPNSSINEDSFKIDLIVEDEIGEDTKQKEKNKKKVNNLKNPLDESQVEYFKIVNGEIKNLIFDTLGIKTSFIKSTVCKEYIETELQEAGRLVYKVKESNPFKELDEITYSIYYLNQSAKSTFSRRMGMQPVEYGHVFVYKNGLRIYPYGERGEDPLKMDNRKAQGYSRFLGTREVIGYISIDGENNNLRETSSRGDGLIKTKTYYQLEEWFYETLKKLERYTIDVTDWGNFLSEDDFINFDQTQIKNDKQFDVNENIQKLINNLTQAKNVQSIELGHDIYELLEQKSEKSAQGTLKSLSEKIKEPEYDKDDVIRSIKKAEKQIEGLKKRKDEAEDEVEIKRVEVEKLTDELNKEIADKLFDQSVIGREKKDLLSLQHQIIHTAGNITWSLDSLIDSINSDKPKDDLIQDIKDISLEVQRIVSASRFVTKAGFNTQAEKITNDIVSFIDDYVNNIYIPADSFIHNKRPITISIGGKTKLKKEMKFRPFEITVVLDNLFSNSRKAKATKIDLTWDKSTTHLILSFSDNGSGIPTEIEKKIFDFRFSETDGSGIGLYHVKDILKKYKSTVEYVPQKRGTTFLIKIPL